MKFTAAALAFTVLADVGSAKKLTAQKERELQRALKEGLKAQSLQSLEALSEAYESGIAVIHNTIYKEGEEPRVPDLKQHSVKEIQQRQRKLRNGSGKSGAAESMLYGVHVEVDDDDHLTAVLNGGFISMKSDDDETVLCNAIPTLFENQVSAGTDKATIMWYGEELASACWAVFDGVALGELNEETGCEETFLSWTSDGEGDYMEIACMGPTLPTVTIAACRTATGGTCTGTVTTDFPLVDISPNATDAVVVAKVACCPIFTVAPGGGKGKGNSRRA